MDRKIKVKILQWLAIIGCMVLLLGINEHHQVERQRQIDNVQRQKLIRENYRLWQENKRLQQEVYKARQVRNVMRRYGCMDRRIFRACMDQPFIKPVQAAIIAGIESEMKPKALSWCGASGVMQIMPHWKLEKPFEPRQNIFFGCWLYRQYLDRYGSWEKAIVAYNVGPGRIGKHIPGETVAYIKKFWRMSEAMDIKS